MDYQLPSVEPSEGPYVYVYMDPRKFGQYEYGNYTFEYEPFYVGMGTNDRCFRHVHEAFKFEENNWRLNKIRKIYSLGLVPILVKVGTCSNRSEAVDLEEFLIEKIGRLYNKTGPLTNVRPGGNDSHRASPEEVSRWNQKYGEEKEEFSRKMSQLGTDIWSGKSESEKKSHGEKVSRGSKGVKKNHKVYTCTLCGDSVRGHNTSIAKHFRINHEILDYGRCLTLLDGLEITRKTKIDTASVGMAGKNQSESTKKKIGKANAGNKSRLGKPHSEETKRKQSEARAGRKFPPREVRCTLCEEIMKCHNQSIKSHFKKNHPDILTYEEAKTYLK